MQLLPAVVFAQPLLTSDNLRIADVELLQLQHSVLLQQYLLADAVLLLDLRVHVLRCSIVFVAIVSHVIVTVALSEVHPTMVATHPAQAVVAMQVVVAEQPLLLLLFTILHQ